MNIWALCDKTTKSTQNDCSNAQAALETTQGSLDKNLHIISGRRHEPIWLIGVNGVFGMTSKRYREARCTKDQVPKQRNIENNINSRWFSKPTQLFVQGQWLELKG